jgi:uncharacterized repeat protein (TIGR02543 family)
LTIGRTCRLSARARPGYVFSGWTGSIASSAPTLTFVFNGGLVPQANFVPQIRWPGLPLLSAAEETFSLFRASSLS